MVLYKNTNTVRQRADRQRHVLQLNIEEMPERPKFLDRTAKERRKFVETCEKTIRSSKEYRDYIKYLKEHFDMDACTIYDGVRRGNGKKYTIEIHHEPFTLFQITDTVLQKKQDCVETINPFTIADEVMDLHYKGWVGLMPLSKTAHELVTNDKIFIPLQYVYQRYDLFFDEYERFMRDYVKELIQIKVNMSMQCDMIQSDVLDPDVTYVDIEGYQFPEIPGQWEDAIKKRMEFERGSANDEPPKVDDGND